MYVLDMYVFLILTHYSVNFYNSNKLVLSGLFMPCLIIKNIELYILMGELYNMNYTH